MNDFDLSRKNFLKLAGIFGAGSALPACARKSFLTPMEEAAPPLGIETFSASVCSLCPAGCGVRVRLIDGLAVGVSGVLDHQVNQGTLCPKGSALLQELYHPDRLRFAQVRSGARAKGSWKNVPWEEALKLVAAKLRPGAFDAVTFSRLRDVGLESLTALGGRVLHFGFAPGEPPLDAHLAMNGGALSCDPAGARLVVSFGDDWLQTQSSHVETQRLWGRLRASIPRAQIVSVAPRFSVTAGKGDSWIPARPGTDGYVALAVARQLLKTGRHERGGRGLDALARAVEPFTFERAAELTGAPEQSLRVLAEKFASQRPAVALGSRCAPAWSQMAVHSLNALCGGLGAYFRASPQEARPAPDSSKLSSVVLIDRVNPVFTAPRAWRAALEKADFVVAVTPYMTETAEYADVVLPCRTPLEQLHASENTLLSGGTTVNFAERSVKPLYDTKDAGEIFLALGRGGDYGDYAKTKAAGWHKRLTSPPAGPVDYAPLASALKDASQPAPKDKDFPLELCVFTPLAFSRGEGAHLPYLQSLAGVQTSEQWETWAEIHPDTAKACGVEDGRKARILSPAGKIEVKARVLSSAMPGVVSVPFGLGHTSYGRWAKGVGANPMELAESFDGARVRMEPV
ncbi:MAG: molybdopterin-dependent oxidoreductase [Elusimicrobia bacterium]|nr:molybdopterin-dependent oxidoreductase [Elusimicrobiota bacterium]